MEMFQFFMVPRTFLLPMFFFEGGRDQLRHTRYTQFSYYEQSQSFYLIQEKYTLPATTFLPATIQYSGQGARVQVVPNSLLAPAFSGPRSGGCGAIAQQLLTSHLKSTRRNTTRGYPRMCDYGKIVVCQHMQLFC